MCSSIRRSRKTQVRWAGRTAAVQALPLCTRHMPAAHPSIHLGPHLARRQRGAHVRCPERWAAPCRPAGVHPGQHQVSGQGPPAPVSGRHACSSTVRAAGSTHAGGCARPLRAKGASPARPLPPVVSLRLKRAGLDYWPAVCVEVHPSWAQFVDFWQRQPGPKQLVGQLRNWQAGCACLGRLKSAGSARCCLLCMPGAASLCAQHAHSARRCALPPTAAACVRAPSVPPFLTDDPLPRAHAPPPPPPAPPPPPHPPPTHTPAPGLRRLFQVGDASLRGRGAVPSRHCHLDNVWCGDDRPA